VFPVVGCPVIQFNPGQPPPVHGIQLLAVGALRVEIASFRTWAETGISELVKLAAE
jgi:hypothetical protein